MTYCRLRSIVRRLLPQPLYAPFRMMENYCRRLLVWPIILFQMRGETFADEIKLLVSAIAAPILSLHRLDRWQDPILLFGATVKVHGIGKFRLRPWCDDLWHALPWRESAIVKAVRRTLRSGDVFIDAGANIGFYSILASKIVGENGRIVAIEMMPDTAHVLRQQLSLNGIKQATVVQRALSSNAGLFVSARCPDGQYGQASIYEDAGSDNNSVQVETTTLDDLLENLPDVAVMKMDLEGAEKQALDGARLINNVRSIIIEDWGDKTDVRDHIESCGYHITDLDGRNFLASI